MKQNNTTKKLALAGVLTALAIVGGFISVPVAGSKCAPVQHMVNILAAVTLGPAWGVGICILCKFTPQSARPRKPYGFPWKHGRCFMLWSCLQNAHLKSYLPCRSDRNRFLGALAAYPVALYLMGIAPAGLFVYVVPFLISTVAGSILAFILITVLEKAALCHRSKKHNHHSFLQHSAVNETALHRGHHLVSRNKRQRFSNKILFIAGNFPTKALAILSFRTGSVPIRLCLVFLVRCPCFADARFL